MRSPTDALRQAFVSNNQGPVTHTAQVYHKTLLPDSWYFCNSDTGEDRVFKDEQGVSHVFVDRKFAIVLPEMNLDGPKPYVILFSNADMMFNDLVFDASQLLVTIEVTYRIYLGDDGVSPAAEGIRGSAKYAEFYGPQVAMQLGHLNIDSKQFPNLSYDTKTFSNIYRGR